jgi:uncharacterized protein
MGIHHSIHDAISRSVQYAVQMAAGKFDNDIIDSIRQKSIPVTAEMIQPIWEHTVKSIGAYKAVSRTEYTLIHSGYMVTVILKYARGSLKVDFEYDTNDKVSNFSMVPCVAPKASALSESDIFIKIGEYPEKLDGILCLPKAVQAPPFVIFVHGSSPHDYDENIGPNKPFKDIADGLAKDGIASLRYNKRTFQYPETALKYSNLEDVAAQDVGFAIDFIKQHDSLKNSAVYILGHSQGGMLAPYIANKIPGITGIINMAGPTGSTEAAILEQQAAILKEFDEKSETGMDADTLNEINSIYNLGIDVGTYPVEKALLLEAIQNQTELIRALKDDSPETILLGIPSKTWRFLNRTNISEICKKLTIPILILQGSADFQVPFINLRKWQVILNENTFAVFRLYNNLNHLLMPSNGKHNALEYDEKSTVDAQVIDDIAAWIALKSSRIIEERT